MMFDFPHAETADISVYAMCIISSMDGIRQAPAMTQATDLAFDNAVIDFYGL